jgi:dTDP-4-amino-4,6-dideoxygalactose transaminase
MAPRASADVTVPLLDLHAQYAPIRAEVLGALTRVADSQQFILGPEVEALERELAAQIEVGHAIGVSSGTDALLAVLMAVGVGPGAEVITPTYSFFATAGCIARLGATPVFVDIDAATFNVTAAAIERALTPATRAIVVVHLFGLSADMDAIRAVADRAGVLLIEDAAQAIGARYRGRPVGGFGAAACFSFFPSKNLGAFGDAGLVTTDDAALAREVRLLRNHGMDPKYLHARLGGNFRLDALQAAVLRVKAPYLSGWTDARRRNADRYRALVHEAGLDGQLVLPVEPEGYTHIYNQFVIRTDRRDDLRAFLTERRVGTEIYYPVPFHRQACFAAYVREGQPYPVADAVAAASLALPIYGELTLEQQRHVVDCITDFLAGGA